VEQVEVEPAPDDRSQGQHLAGRRTQEGATSLDRVLNAARDAQLIERLAVPSLVRGVDVPSGDERAQNFLHEEGVPTGQLMQRAHEGRPRRPGKIEDRAHLLLHLG